MPNKLAHITVLEATKMKKKSSITDQVQKNGATEKCEYIPTRLERVCSHEILEVKALHLKYKARLSWNTAVP